MIDLSKVKGLADGVKGAIKQIADAAGNVLWKQAPSEATVTIVEIGGTGYTSGCGWSKITIDGITYTSAATVTVPIGTAIYCEVIGGGSSKPYIEVNGVRVVEGYGNKEDGYTDCSYTHIVASDITVEFYGNKGSGQIVITEQ